MFEIKNLDFDKLDPQSSLSCIYGQMAGNCYNSRARNLIYKCAIRVYKSNPKAGGSSLFKKLKLNGKPDTDAGRGRGDGGISALSPIEVFIEKNNVAHKPDNNKILIDYLQGKTNRLKFK